MTDRVLEMLRLSIRSLALNATRSLLTLLGVIFGVAAVIAMMAAGAGAREELMRTIGSMGITNIIVQTVKPPEEGRPETSGRRPGRRIFGYGLHFRDLDQIEATVPGVEAVLPVQQVKKRLWHRSRQFEARVLGVMPDYFGFFNMHCVRGRFIADLDIHEARRVCVVGSRFLEELGYYDDPLDLSVRIGGEWFGVCGVYEQPAFLSPGTKALGRGGLQMDVYVPYDVARRRYGIVSFQQKEGSREFTRVELDQIIVRTKGESEVLRVAKLVEAVLRKSHEKMDYEIIVPLELLRQRQKTQKVFSAVMVAIAGISLLVGGIGIVNIMLATVTERTSEIGVRRACGARKREIMLQFLIETLTLTLLGGVLGCALGVSGAALMSRFSEWRTIITPASLLMAMGISCAVGVIFGMYPAHKAAEMDPIEALRYE